MRRSAILPRRVLIILIVGFLVLGTHMEQELLAQLASPEVHADGRVTFRIRAPRAERVAVEGIAGLEPQALTEGEDAVWELTVGPLPPERYSYVFDVDGTKVPDPHNRHVKKWLSVNSQFEIPGHPPLLHEQQPVPHGVVHHHVCRSQTTGTERGVFVYTPPNYAADGETRYPLLLLLHGYGDDESAWLEVGCANWIADNLLHQKRIQPLVIAMPYGHPLPLDLRRKFDDYAAQNGERMERDVLEDLVPQLGHWYRLQDDRLQRAIVGLSMGGGQALTIGLRHLDQFAWVGGFSSAAPQGDMSGAFAPLLRDVDETNRQLRLLWVGCGRDDFLLERNQAFVQWLNERRIAHTYRETDGGHDWMVWRKYLAEFLPQLFR